MEIKYYHPDAFKEAVSRLSKKPGIPLRSLADSEKDYQRYNSFKKKTKSITSAELKPLFEKSAEFKQHIEDAQREMDLKSEQDVNALIAEMGATQTANFERLERGVAGLQRDLSYIIELLKKSR